MDIKPNFPIKGSPDSVYNNSILSALVNNIGAIPEDNGMAVYLDFEMEDNISDSENGMPILKLGTKTKHFSLEPHTVTYNSVSPKHEVEVEYIHSLSTNIIKRLFELGEENAKNIRKELGGSALDLDLNIEPPPSKIKVSFWRNPIQWIKDLFSPRVQYIWAPGQTIVAKHQRIISKILALSSLVNNKTRRGMATTIICGAKLGAILQDCNGFQMSPIEDITIKSMYLIGVLHGHSVYVNPNMSWNDNRILVFRKGDALEPGLQLAYKQNDLQIVNIPSTDLYFYNGHDSELVGNIKLVEVGSHPEYNFITTTFDSINDLI